MSGLQLHGFRQGWAIVIGNFGTGHYFRRIGLTDEVVSACGLHAAVRSMWGIGTWTPCRKCRRKHGVPTDVRTLIELEQGRVTP
jgi:hypothetical protein